MLVVSILKFFLPFVLDDVTSNHKANNGVSVYREMEACPSECHRFFILAKKSLVKLYRDWVRMRL